MYHHTVSPAAYIKPDAAVHAKSHRFSFLLSKLFAFIHCSLRLTTSCSTMSGKANQTSNVVGDIPMDDSQSATEMESETASSTSSTMADQAIATKEIPPLYQFWKALMVMDKDITTYRDATWLPEVLFCTHTTLDFSDDRPNKHRLL
jgi:hypothetical protein